LRGEGIARAITAALQQAGVTPDQLDHVNAQGYGTVQDDIAEAAGMVKALGPKPPPVFAAKGYFGSMGAAGGAVELAASLLALQHRTLPPSLNHETPDERCPVPVHAGQPRPTTKDYALKISFTDLGQCAAVVVKRWSE
jgi:3-oxoacyl-[acyl-carrier-protein] synthase II